MAKAKQIKITLRRSTIGQKPDVVATVCSLGLRRISSSVIQNDTDPVRGMVRAVSHLVTVEEVK